MNGEHAASKKEPAATFHIRTYGCQMNERDSESVAALLTADGLSPAASEETADVLIYNTCSVRDQAERKAAGKLGIMKRLKRVRPDIVIGVIGCMAQSRGAELLEEIPHLDFAVGTGQIHRLPEIAREALRHRRRLCATESDGSGFEALDAHYDGPAQAGPAANVAVMRGCERYCSYCIVPYVRGPERSRPLDDIVREVRGLVAAGKKELLLLGQNIAAYGLDGSKKMPSDDVSPFADLLRALDGVEGLERIRFTSPHPAYFNSALIDAVASLDAVCESVHLPLQSGSDRILKLMNRHYTGDSYMAIVRRLKALVPDITFSTDVIVGFPGETDADFQRTRDLMNEAAFDNAFIFKYSPRRNTPAATMDGHVPQSVREERNQILLGDLAERVKKRNASMTGRVMEVLAEGPSPKNPSRWAGRSRSNIVIVFEPVPGLKSGGIIKTKIIKSSPVTLLGEITAD
jgi:tRNA-2-methylthio-N6-dimethylallyladenosine synthase